MTNDAEERLNQYLAKTAQAAKPTWKDKLGHAMRKTAVTLAAVGTLGAIGAGVLGYDYITKREAFPIRNVLFQTKETVHFAGGEKHVDSRSTDRKSDTVIQKGSEDGTKLGDVVGGYHYDRSDELMQYTLEDQNKNRIAYASEKREPFQGGLRVGGSVDFREMQAEIMGHRGKYIAYTVIPERGSENIQLNVLVDDAGKMRLVNELVTGRHTGLGWMYGDKYRSFTALNEFNDTVQNETRKMVLLESIRAYNSGVTLPKAERERLVQRILEIESSMEKSPVFVSYEDGYFGILPQESSTFLFGNPSFVERMKNAQKAMQVGPVKPLAPKGWETPAEFHAVNPDGKIVKLRVENQWDLFPGNYWGLNHLSIGKHPNTWRPFAHYNNGGHTIEDARGTVAKIVIQDFLFHYGDDVLYKYFLDKNGDGKIDERTELIGQVLYRTSNDEKDDLEGVIGKGLEKRDVSRRYIYSFMAGSDWATRESDFYLCNTIESFMANEINRGFGKHSYLGWINEQRSNILLSEARTVPNLGRALSPESSIVSKHDIIALLRAAGRTYQEQHIVK